MRAAVCRCLLGRVGRWVVRRWLALTLGTASAVLAFVGFCGFDQWYLMWIALVPVLWALDDKSLSGWEAFALSWFFGTVGYIGGYAWIADMLQKFGDLMPQFVRKLMTHQPHILVNLTNDAWFGKSREPIIHLALSIFRAVEHRRFLVRATNTGISAFVDPAGRILEATPVFERANMLRKIPPLTGRTLYGRLGDWVVVPCLLAVAFWALRMFRTYPQPD